MKIDNLNLLLGVVLMGSTVFAGVHPVPEAPQLRRINAEFERVALMHFGPDTFTDKEWGYGDEDPKCFNPTEFDAEQIVRACRDGGLQGLVVVAKHHDGFCLWPTKTTDHNVSKSPFRGGKGDVIREMSDACRKYGLKFGCYVSPWDRHDADYAKDAYRDKFHEQWRELATNYGPLFCCWLDGANGGDGWYGGTNEKRAISGYQYYDTLRLKRELRALHPEICFMGGGDGVCNFRWTGVEDGWLSPDARCGFRAVGDPVTPGWDNSYYRGDPNGTLFVQPECDFPLRPGWFYHKSHDGQVKSGEYLMRLYLSGVGNGGVMEIGVSPDQRGKLHDTDVKELKLFDTLRRQFFANKVAEGVFPAGGGDVAIPHGDFNVVELREDLSAGELIDAWELQLVTPDGNREPLLAGPSIGVKRIRVLPAAVSGAMLRLQVLRSAAPSRTVSFRLYRADRDLVERVLGAKEPSKSRATGALEIRNQ